MAAGKPVKYPVSSESVRPSDGPLPSVTIFGRPTVHGKRRHFNLTLNHKYCRSGHPHAVSHAFRFDSANV